MTPDILTSGGKLFSFERPEECSIEIIEIAHALSHICRFTGHTSQFYSVAQHSVLVSHLVPEEHALSGLLHDAAEAFIGDVSSPLKSLLPDYKVIEKRVEKAIFARFELPETLDPSVKTADMVAYLTERRDLMPSHHIGSFDSSDGLKPIDARIIPVSPEGARRAFLNRYAELLGAIAGQASQPT